jgi:hypothetical protein
MQIYMIYGQGGIIFSWGFNAFGKDLEKLGYKVSYWDAQRPDLIVSDVLNHHIGEKIVLLGYSLGANSTTWVAGGWQGGVGLSHWDRQVDLLVAYDPTVNVYLTPVGENVKQAICYQQTSRWWPTSLFFGRAVLTGKNVEVYKVSEDHLAVQSDAQLHRFTLAAIKELGNGF